MHPHTTPHHFAVHNVDVIRAHWRGVLDGDAESIHQARIATRRLRAALTVIDGRSSDRIKLCRRLGRRLGAVRDADVTQEVLASMGTRLPAGACAVAAVRRIVAQDQDRARRRLANMLDRLKLRPLATLRDRPSLVTLTFWKDWRAAVGAEVAARQHRLSIALDRAPAIYMPRRLHRVRIAVKKLRYALELTDAVGMDIAEDTIRDLRKSQDVLGRIHDLDSAKHIVARLDSADDGTSSEARMLDAVMQADCAALHDKYLLRRQRLRDICDNKATVSSPRPVLALRIATGALPVAGTVAVWWLSAAGERPHP